MLLIQTGRSHFLMIRSISTLVAAALLVGCGSSEDHTSQQEPVTAAAQEAYDATSGPATRFQWGYYYLAGLYHRPKSQLGRIENYLFTWSDENDYSVELEGIRTSVLEICATASHQDESRSTCDAFLERV
jgi:hypothetical protein